MAWLDWLEKRAGFLDMPGLLRYVSFFMLLIFGLGFTETVRIETWALHWNSVLSGEVWRILTFPFLSVSQNPIFFFFELMILVLMGDGLENVWGSFRLTVYYLIGVLSIIALAFFFPYAVFDSSYLKLTLFLAFATIFPDFELLLFFVIPVKVKYLAWLSGFGIIYTVATAPLDAKFAALLSIANYLLFFGPAAWASIRTGAKSYQRRREFESASKPAGTPRNVCSVCGGNEISNPDLQFRYCTCPSCGAAGKAFCMEHLAEHKKTPPPEPAI